VKAYGLVLAAGQGRRFGGGKLLASYRGRPLLSHVLDVVVAALERNVLEGGLVVVGADDEPARALTEGTGLEPVVNDAPHLGLSHSVQLGLSALEEQRDPVDAAVIFLGDQPMVRLAVVEALTTAWRSGSGSIVRPRYQGSPHVPGHPTLLDRSIWPLARHLQGDRGFSALLATADTFLLDVPGDNPDVDTRADLHALEESPP
jgi:molybdenum cofactor cytidylyltransferase